MFTKILAILITTITTTAYATDSVFKPSEDLVNQVKQLEGFSACSYWDHKKMSIGYGSQRLENGKHVPGTVKGKKFCISEERATVLLKRDLEYKGALVMALLFDKDVYANQEMFDALTSFTFNLGIGSLIKSDILDSLAKGKCKTASTIMKKYNKASGKVLKGLVERRKIEANLLEEGCKDLKFYNKKGKLK